MLVAPERRMSSWLMTKIAAPVFDNFCSLTRDGSHLHVQEIFQIHLRQIGLRWRDGVIGRRRRSHQTRREQ